MNAFFKCAELGRYAEFPLKVMSENFPMDNITLNKESGDAGSKE